MPAHPLFWLRTDTTPIHRYIACPECGRRYSVQRRGWAGGALTATAKLRALMSTHLQELHGYAVSNGVLKAPISE